MRYLYSCSGTKFKIIHKLWTIWFACLGGIFAISLTTAKMIDAQNLGQLGLYVSAVNHLIKSPADNPTIGLLICRSKDNVVAKYALESTSLPIGISEYELAKVYPQDFQSTLPSIEQIEKELSKQVKLATHK